MKLGIVGTGHVGLPTAAALAHLGNEVVATDSDREKLALFGAGTLPFYEPGLQELVREGVAAGRLSFSEDAADAVQNARMVFICVGTPPRSSGESNLLALERSVETVARHATGDVIIVEKSTVPIGTGSRLQKVLERHRQGVSFELVSNPEFLREGQAVQDSLYPTRVLVGSDSPQARSAMKELYAPLIESGATWVETDLRTAELAKHACNAFLAMKVSYINAVARLCELGDADVLAIADVMGLDPRIGRDFLDAGLGYGGSCFPKDLMAFERLANRLGYGFPLLHEIARINDDAIDATFHKIEEELWNLEEKRIALLGLAFKPNTDDVRFAPALALARRLLEAEAEVVGYDPRAGTNAKADLPQLEIAGDPYAALEGAHCAVICTEWEEFRHLDLRRAKEAMATPVLVDGRNIFDAADVVAEGFVYMPTGRPRVRP